MDHELICTWLGLSSKTWPPDHYTLLGLPAGESNAERIEQNVQHRMERVRRYQLTNPEAATEAMNRLAQAFVCLSDPQTKRAYDRSLFGGPAAPEEKTDADHRHQHGDEGDHDGVADTLGHALTPLLATQPSRCRR